MRFPANAENTRWRPSDEKAIASGKALAHEQIQAIADFFETFDPDREAPGWQNNEYSSPD
ncbi:MAG: hypothetical protein ACRCU2_09260 [Planktothrix sp.]